MRSPAHLSTIIVLLALMAGSAQGLAQASRKIYGQVLLPPGMVEPPQGLRVTLTTPGGDFVGMLNLSGQTSFLFPRVQPGQYFVNAECPGFASGSQSVHISSRISGDEQSVTVSLGQRLSNERSDLPRDGPATVDVGAMLMSKEAQKELDRARKESERNKPEKAVKHYRAALEIHPQLYQAYNNLAIEYLKLNKPEDAIDCLAKSIELHPEDPTTYRNLAQIYLSHGSLDSAMEELQRSEGLEPSNSKTLRLMGEVHLARSDCDSAVELFLEASGIDPGDRAYLGLAQCYLQAGRYPEATVELEDFLRLNPQDPRGPAVQKTIDDSKANLP